MFFCECKWYAFPTITKSKKLLESSVSRIVVRIRQRIAEEAERASPFGGTVKVDEIYFRAKRVRGKRGRSASGETIVFGIFKRNGSVYTEIVPNCKARTLQAIICRPRRASKHRSLGRLARL